MTTVDYQSQVDALLAAANKRATANGVSICKDVYEKALPILEWLDYLRTHELTGVADTWVNGVQAAIIEVAGCLTLGLVRPAIFSLRAQVDMLLGWLYFKDHPIELRCVEDTGKGFKLKSEVFSYLSDLVPRFKERFAILNQVKTRREEDPYKLLSAHIHSQSQQTIPTIGMLDSIIRTVKICNECIEAQEQVSEYMCDILLAYYANKWVGLPKSRLKSAQKRMNMKQQKAFFSN